MLPQHLPLMQNPFDEIPESDSLRLWPEAHPDGLLINVLPENAFEEARIPGSKNACTYEMAFLGTMDLLAPDRSTEMVVYGKCSKTLEADAAIEKLGQAGYTKAKIYRGGIDAWSKAGFPTRGMASHPRTHLRRVFTP